MSDGIELQGLNEFMGFIDDCNITQEDEARAIKKAMVYMQRYIQPKAPKGKSGETEKSIKVKIKKNDFSTEGILYVDSWYAIFQNFRNIRQQGNYIGWFDKGVEDAEGQALNIIAEELL